MLDVAPAKALRARWLLLDCWPQTKKSLHLFWRGYQPSTTSSPPVLGTSDLKLDLDMLLGKLLTVEQRTSATAPLDDVAYSSRAALQHHQPAAPRHPLSHPQRHLPRLQQANSPPRLTAPAFPQRECYFCGRRRHLRRDCPRRKQAAQQAAASQRPPSGHRKQYLVAFTASAINVSTSLWVLDSGATQHIARDLDILNKIQPLDKDISPSPSATASEQRRRAAALYVSVPSAAVTAVILV